MFFPARWSSKFWNDNHYKQLNCPLGGQKDPAKSNYSSLFPSQPGLEIVQRSKEPQYGRSDATFWQVILFCRGLGVTWQGHCCTTQGNVTEQSMWLVLLLLCKTTVHLKGLWPNTHNLHQALQKVSPSKHTLQVKINVLAQPTRCCCPHPEGPERLTKHMTTRPLHTCQISISPKAKNPN